MVGRLNIMNWQGFGRKWPWPNLDAIPEFVSNRATPKRKRVMLPLTFFVSSGQVDGSTEFVRNFMTSVPKRTPPPPRCDRIYERSQNEASSAICNYRNSGPDPSSSNVFQSDALETEFCLLC
jgi:hypothetical protein